MIPRVPSRKRNRTTNRWRLLWLRMRHNARLMGFFARNGKFGLYEVAWEAMHRDRNRLGLPCTKGLEP